MADPLQNIGAELFNRGITSGGASGAGGGALLGILPNIEMRSLGIQGISLLDKPICQSSVFASVAFNTPGSKSQQNFIHKLAASIREDFSKMAQNAGVMYNGPITNGAPVSSGLAMPSGGGAELG